MRIIAGEFKGRRLLSPSADSGARPITGSVKKSLFGMLADLLPGATVVDLYCATGTLGLEALSRGARRCFFADREARLLERLRRNIAAVAAGDRCEIWRGDIERILAGRLKGLDEAVTLAFVDPPYARTRRWDWRQAGERLFQPLAGKLADDGLVVLRSPAGREAPGPLGGLEIRRVRRYGDMIVTMYGRAHIV